MAGQHYIKGSISTFLYHRTLALEREKMEEKPYFALPAETRREKGVGQEARTILNRSRVSTKTLVVKGGRTLKDLYNS